MALNQVAQVQWVLAAALTALKNQLIAPFQKLTPYEDALMNVPIPGQRACLEEMGFPLTKDTYLVDAPPRPGPLTVRIG